MYGFVIPNSRIGLRKTARGTTALTASQPTISKNDGVPNFKSEEEETKWMRSAAGRRHFEQPGKPVNRVRAKRTQAVSLRLTVADIEAAKKIGAQTGLGYQTVLKEIISKGLR